MRKSLIAIVIISLLFFPSCATNKAAPTEYISEINEPSIDNKGYNTATTKDDRKIMSDFSYTIGYQHGEYLNANNSLMPNFAYMIRGILDLSKFDTAILLFTPDDMVTIYDNYNSKIDTITKYQSPGKELSISKINQLPPPTKERNQYSYAYGYILGSNAVYQFGNIDFHSFIEGIQHALFGHTPRLTEQEFQQSIDNFNTYLVIQNEQQLQEMAEENLKTAEAFLRENKKKSNVQSINNYCQIEFTHKSQRKTNKVKLNDDVRLNYVMRTLDGQIIDQGKNIVFPMDMNQMIIGFVEGCTAMSVGDKATVYVHPAYGYGEYGIQNIEPNMLLVFDIEILEIIK